MVEAPPKAPPLQLGSLDEVKKKNLVPLDGEPVYLEGITEDKVFVACVKRPQGESFLYECNDQTDINDAKFFYRDGIEQWYEKKIP